MAKFIFVTGGVVSSLGKGITAASMGRLLKSRGLKVTVAKFDPYINVDPGTWARCSMGGFRDRGRHRDRPGSGHYERFIDELRQVERVTGKVYSAVINRERRGDFLNGWCKSSPRRTVKDCIHDVARGSGRTSLLSIGGTVN